MHTSRSAVFGDFDNDGGVDVLVVNKDANAYLLMNVHPDRSNAVTLRILNESGTDALGAVVTASVGAIKRSTPVQSTWSYMAANDPRVHFGLGTETQLEDVTVHYVDGSKKNFGSFTHGFYDLLK